MATLLVLVGLPGSGKSTLARRWVDADPAHRARVSRDDLRMMGADVIRRLARAAEWPASGSPRSKVSRRKL